MFGMAICLKHGIGIKAYEELADCYIVGRGVKPDLEKAAKLRMNAERLKEG